MLNLSYISRRIPFEEETVPAEGIIICPCGWKGIF